MFAKSRRFFYKLIELTLVAVFGFGQLTFAQNSTAILNAQTMQVALGSSDRGTILSVRPIAVLEVSPVHALLQFESVQDEIDLTDHQKLKIQRFLETAESERKSALKLLIANRQEAARVLELAQYDFEKSANEILLPTQLDTIEKIGLRIHMQVVGIESFLNRKPFELSGFEQARVSEVLAKHSKMIAKSAIQIKEKVYDNILHQLSPEKKEEVLTKFPLSSAKVPLLHLTAQLQHVSRLKKLDDISDIGSGLDVINYWGQYSMARDGSFRLETLGADRLKAFHISMIIQSSSHLPESVRNQVKQLEEKQSTIRHQNMVERANLSSMGFAFDRQLFKEQETILQQEMVDLCKKLVQDSQSEPFIESCLETNVLQNGLIVELVNGPLSKRLELSKAERESLRKEASRVLREIKQEIIELEQKLLGDVFQALDGTNRQHFVKIADWRPKAICPDLYMLLRTPDSENVPTPIFLEW
jgi:predicted outer membrane protein